MRGRGIMIRPTDILAEGKALLALPASQRTEVRRRTIISRAYYAAFHFLRSHPCAELPLPPEGPVGWAEPAKPSIPPPCAASPVCDPKLA
jgi:hypothetical protein